MRATRGKTKAEYQHIWFERINQFKTSGLSQNNYAKQLGVSPKTLQHWLNHFNDRNTAIVPVQLIPAQSSVSVVKLKLNHCELVFDQPPNPSWIVQVIKELGGA